MPTFISMLSWTDQGIRSLKDTPKRVQAAREMAHQDLGTQLLNRVKDDTSKFAKIEQEPRFEGRQVVMVLAPR